MRSMLCTVFIMVAFLVTNTRSQENENSDESNIDNNDEDTDEDADEDTDDNNDQDDAMSLWSRFINAVKKFVKDVMGFFREFKAVFEKKTRGVVVWTEELWARMKRDMNEWIDEYDYATDEEKREMRMYLDKLQMPKESDEDEYY